MEQLYSSVGLAELLDVYIIVNVMTMCFPEQSGATKFPTQAPKLAWGKTAAPLRLLS